jgi:hypothetical protein
MFVRMHRIMFAVVLVGCGSERETQPIATDAGSITADGTGEDTQGSEDGIDGGSDDEKLDTPSGMDGGSAEGSSDAGCKKVDFLFVVDSSGSMQDEQQNLANSFPGFIDVIEQETMVDDFHIMAVDTDAAGLVECAILCGLLPDCNGIPCDQIPQESACDATLGAGRRTSANGQDCGFAGEQRYIVSGQADLSSTFSCAAQVGTMGSGDEMAIEAMTAAIGEQLNGAGQCNDAFLRDDAILVVTLITDESNRAFGQDAANETPSPGAPDGWYESLVARKAGNESAIVVLGLIGDNDQPNAICGDLDLNTLDGAEPAPDLRQFVEMFGDNGVVGSVCEGDYAPFFSSAVSVIQSACDDFVPPG